jgi:membrane protease YdiL (CAAX protease family)
VRWARSQLEISLTCRASVQEIPAVVDSGNCCLTGRQDFAAADEYFVGESLKSRSRSWAGNGRKPHDHLGDSMQEPNQRHTWSQTIALHIGPGLIVIALFALFAPWTMRLGYPPMMALLLAMLLGGMGIQACHLGVLGYRRHGRLTLRDVVLMNERLTPWGYSLGAFVLLVVAFVGLLVTTPVDQWLLTRFETILPKWYFVGALESLQEYSPQAVRTTFVLRLALDGLVIPLIEELYFRGYLLPRMPDIGRGTIFMHHILFALYHLWQPYNFPTIFVATLPMVWWAWRCQSWRLAWAAHTAINVVGGLLTLALVSSRG